MHLIDGAGHVNNQFVHEDIQTGRPPTEITSDWMNAIQNEIANFILAAGMNLVKVNNTQLRDALSNTFARRDGTIHYIGQVYNIVADQATLAEVPTGALQPGTKILVTSYYGPYQAAMATLVNGAWVPAPLALNIFDLYGTDYDSHGYYWFSNTWNLFDVSAMQVEEATEQESGIVRLASWPEVLAGSLAAVLRPRHMVDYIDRMFVGQLADFGGNTAPIVWIPVDGQLVSRSERPLLWQYALGSGILVPDTDWPLNTGKFSSGDGTANFRLPDLRGEFRRSADKGRGIDPGRQIGTQQADQMRKITGSINNVQKQTTAAFVFSGAFCSGGAVTPNGNTGGSSPAHTVNFDSSLLGANYNGADTHPRNIAYPTHIYAGVPA